MSAKEEYLTVEGDAWFERNCEDTKENENIGIHLFCEFYEKMRPKLISDYHNVLEIGCSYGYGLAYLIKKYDFMCNGIDPSNKAIKYGKQLYETLVLEQKLKLIQGTSDDLPYENNSMDVVFFGFCLYQVERDLLMRSMYEADRVLRKGGLIVITDFDTPVNYKRINKHNWKCPTWKMDYAKMFLSNACGGYTLVEKRTYSHESDGFTPDIQERVSTQFLYKEDIEALWK